jgi:hypothetical protein
MLYLQTPQGKEWPFAPVSMGPNPVAAGSIIEVIEDGRKMRPRVENSTPFLISKCSRFLG